MPDETKDIHEVLIHLRQISQSIISNEHIYEDISHIRKDSNIKITEVREEVKEIKADVKDLKNNFDEMDTTLGEFKKEMAPIIEIKNNVRTTMIKYSAIMFVSLLTISEIGITG